MTMERSGLERRLREAVVEQSGNVPEVVKAEASFANDLGMDDLDVTELVMFAEFDLNIDIPEDALEQMKTFGDFCDAVEKRLP